MGGWPTRKRSVTESQGRLRAVSGGASWDYCLVAPEALAKPAMPDSPLWTIDSLVPFCAHDDDEVRAWAVERLGNLRDPAGAPALLRALDDASVAVVMNAVTALGALGETLDRAAAREPLRRTARRADLPHGPTRGAQRLLLLHGDPDAAEETLAACLGDRGLTHPWIDLVTYAPGHLRRLATERGLFAAPHGEPECAVVLLPRVATLDELPAVYRNLEEISEVRPRDLLMNELLHRCHAERFFLETDEDPPDFEEILEERGRAYAGGQTSEAALRWLSVETFGALLEMLAEDRWAQSIAWCARWCADHEVGDDEASSWGRGLLLLLEGESAPGELRARAAACIALAAAERAIERERPFATCGLGEQFVRACGGPQRIRGDRWATIEARWRERTDDPEARSEVGEALRRVIEEGTEPARSDALDLATRLPGIPLPTRVLSRSEEAMYEDDERLMLCLAAQPEALRALAAVALDSVGDGSQCEVLEALGRQNGGWVAELLRPRFEGLLRTEYTDGLFNAVRDLGDVALLPEVVAAWRPGEESVADVALHLARVGGREDFLPAGLVRDAVTIRERGREAQSKLTASVGSEGGLEAMLGAADDAPLVVELRCNRCERAGRYDPGRAVVNPDAEACKREGWDGVTFQQIVVCKFCGAEDDYTLGPTAFLSIMAGSLGALYGGKKRSPAELQSSRMVISTAVVADGTLIRRASDALRHWKQKTERNPRDAEAWMRLGGVLKTNYRIDAAIDAFRRSIELRPGHLDAPGGLLEMLLVVGRGDEGVDLPQVILAALPESGVTTEAKTNVCELVVEFLRRAVAGGQPLGMRASWRGGEVRGKVLMNLSSIDLRRVKRWDRLAEFLAHPNLVEAGLKEAEAIDARTRLEDLIESGASLGSGAALGTRATVARVGPKLGRNDPCHCGSGKKYKKCHGA